MRMSESHVRAAILLVAWLAGCAGPRAAEGDGTSKPSDPSSQSGEGKTVETKEQLKQLNIKPEQVKYVGISHFHADHTGQLDTVPNATLLIGQKEWDAITAQKPMQGANVAGFKHWISGGGKVEPQAADKDVFGDGTVMILRTPGHTPGHLSFEVAGSEGLLITADATTNQIISFEHPEWKFGFDSDHDTAIKTRRTLLDRAATDRLKLIGFHWLYPGVGYAERKGGAYRYVAAS